MKTLNIKVVNPSANNSYINIDGKLAKINRGKNGTGVITHQTEKDSVRISICTHMELKGKFWWLTSIFFFLISIFGIFDLRTNGKCRAIEYEADVSVYENANFTLRLMRWKDGKEAVTLVDATATENKNICFVDQVALRRKKIMVFVKIATTVALLTLLGFVLL